MVYCEKIKAKKSSFDRRSFRWVKRNKTRVLIGCPKGKWDDKRSRCRVGTRAYAVLKPAKGKRCPVGSKRIRKR
jgi:hypothetical protein